MKIHEVKILEEFALKEHNGLKPWELRKNDRDYQVGDVINFTVIRLKNSHEFEEVGRYQRGIEYIYQDNKYGLEKGYCIMTLGNVK